MMELSQAGNRHGIEYPASKLKLNSPPTQDQQVKNVDSQSLLFYQFNKTKINYKQTSNNYLTDLKDRK